VEDRLAGTLVPVLSISLDPGESIVAEAGEFSWMTDSIQMTAGLSTELHDKPGGTRERADGAAAWLLSTFTAKGTAGTIAFACKQPGSILEVGVSPGSEYLVHRHGFLAGTSQIRVWPGFRQAFSVGIYSGGGFGLQRVSGDGRAWIEFAGEVVKFDLAAGESLRAHPGHIGMFAASVAFQLMRVPGIANRYFGPEAHHFAVLSGPGPVWLQSMSMPALTASAAPFLLGTNSSNTSDSHPAGDLSP
jgi:uncharacterized protein (AIM24 family)